MSLLAWLTIAVFAVLLAAVAVVLLVIVALLWRTRSTLDDVVDSLEAVADAAAPIGPSVAQVVQQLGPARDALVAAAPPTETENAEWRASVSN